MDLAAIFHGARAPYVQPLGADHVFVRLIAAAGDLTEVSCVYADKYDPMVDHESEIALSVDGSDGVRDWWVGVLPVPTRRLRYWFKLRGRDGSERPYTEHGFAPISPKNQRGYFFFPYNAPADRFRIPAWLPGTTLYLVFPERFDNGDPSNDPPETRPWGEAPTPRSFFGGDLAGIERRLPWLRELGVGGLYLTPVFTAPSNHKYDPASYEEVDPSFGTNDDLRRLVELSHAQGMRVIIDGVFNHSGSEWFAFRDAREKGAASPYWSWFYRIDGQTVDVDRVNYETFGPRLRNHPKLNLADPRCAAYFLGIGERWIRDAHVDGWRLDVANEVDHRFWRAFRDRVKAADPEAFILGEVWHDAARWLEGDQFDSVMSYPWRDAVIQYLRGMIGPRAFAAWTARLRHLYQPAVTPGLVHLLGSHDTARIRTELGGSAARARLGAVLLLTSTGVPLVYYGDEIGMSGDDDPGSRGCMEWDPPRQDRRILDTYRALIQLRRAAPWLAWGAFEDLAADDARGVYAYRRTATGPLALLHRAGEGEVLVALNTGTSAASIELPVTGGTFRDALGGSVVQARSGSVTVALAPDDAAVLVRDPG